MTTKRQILSSERRIQRVQEVAEELPGVVV